MGFHEGIFLHNKTRSRSESMKNLANNLGALLTGKRVLVTIDTELAAQRALCELDIGAYLPLEEVVDTAMRQSVINIGDQKKFEQWYGLPDGSLWDRGGHHSNYDATKPVPSFEAEAEEERRRQVLQDSLDEWLSRPNAALPPTE